MIIRSRSDVLLHAQTSKQARSCITNPKESEFKIHVSNGKKLYADELHIFLGKGLNKCNNYLPIPC